MKRRETHPTPPAYGLRKKKEKKKKKKVQRDGPPAAI
jgi:hypothetical protein